MKLAFQINDIYADVPQRVSDSLWHSVYERGVIDC